MRVQLRVLAHFADFDDVVRRNRRNRHDQARCVDRSQFVSKNDAGGTDGQDFLEDTADAKRNDRSTLQEGEFRRRHQECKATGEQQDAEAEKEAALLSHCDVSSINIPDAFDWDCYNEESDEHDRSEKEY